MDFKGIMLSEASQAEKDKYCMIPLICVESEKNQQTLVSITKKMQTHRYREKLVVNSGRERWERAVSRGD